MPILFLLYNFLYKIWKVHKGKPTIRVVLNLVLVRYSNGLLYNIFALNELKVIQIRIHFWQTSNCMINSMFNGYHFNFQEIPCKFLNIYAIPRNKPEQLNDHLITFRKKNMILVNLSSSISLSIYRIKLCWCQSLVNVCFYHCIHLTYQAGDLCICFLEIGCNARRLWCGASATWKSGGTDDYWNWNLPTDGTRGVVETLFLSLLERSGLSFISLYTVSLFSFWLVLYCSSNRNS